MADAPASIAAIEKHACPACGAAAEWNPGKQRLICPFCGTLNETADGPCPRCRMEDTPATRKATKARIGPWSHAHHGVGPGSGTGTVSRMLKWASLNCFMPARLPGGVGQNRSNRRKA